MASTRDINGLLDVSNIITTKYEDGTLTYTGNDGTSVREIERSRRLIENANRVAKAVDVDLKARRDIGQSDHFPAYVFQLASWVNIPSEVDCVKPFHAGSSRQKTEHILETVSMYNDVISTFYFSHIADHPMTLSNETEKVMLSC